MDLGEFVLPAGSGWNLRPRDHAIEFFSGLANDSRISRDLWRELMNIGEQAYFTTFTDDSGYIEGQMAFHELDNLPAGLRTDLLKYIHGGGNWIVQSHVEDYVRKHGLEPL